MNAGIACHCVLFSLILSLIAFYLPHWKSIHLRSTSSLPMLTIDENEVDPLIGGELEKYTEILYRRGEYHRFGLTSHCIINHSCGENRLLTYPEENYEYCHNLKSHHECIFSKSSSSSSSDKCLCEKPFYLFSCLFLLIIRIEQNGNHLREPFEFFHQCIDILLVFKSIHFPII